MKKKIKDLKQGDVVMTLIGEREIHSIKKQLISNAYDIIFTNGDYSMDKGNSEIEVLIEGKI